jgi:hypothetical protein
MQGHILKVCNTEFIILWQSLHVAAQMSRGVVFYRSISIVLYRKQYLGTFVQLHEDFAKDFGNQLFH